MHPAELLSRLHSDEDIEVIVEDMDSGPAIAAEQEIDRLKDELAELKRKQKKRISPAVTVAILRKRHRVRGEGKNGFEVLLVLRLRKPGIGSWALPAGGMQWGEIAEEAAAREMKEELGLTLDPNKLGPPKVVTSLFPDLGLHALMIAFHVIGDFDPLNLAPEESEQIKWFDVDLLPSPLMQDDAEIIRWAVEQQVSFDRLNHMLVFGEI